MNRMLTFRVKERDRQGWGGIALITAGQWICIPAFMVGGMLSEGLSPAGLVFCVAAGALILLACACFMGAQSCESGLPAMVVSVDGLGVRGARFVPGLLITITCVGWFGIQAAACGASFSVMTAGILGFSIPAWASGLFWGAVMTVSAVNGYRVLRTLSFIMVPVLLVLLVYTVIHGVFFPEAGSAAALLAWRPAEPVSYTKGISLILGTWSLGAFYIGDYCRYGEKSRDVTLSLSVCLILMIPLMFLSGAVFRIIAKNPDITIILTGMGYPAMALVFLILATWTTNIMNAYSGGIALSILLGHEEKRLKINTVLTGITGTVLGAAGILSRFTEFLSLLSSFVPPLIGVLIGAKIVGLLRRGRNEGDNPLIPSKPIGGGGGVLYET